MQTIFSSFSSAHTWCQRQHVYEFTFLALAVISVIGIVLGALWLSGMPHLGAAVSTDTALYLTMGSTAYFSLYIIYQAIHFRLNKN